MDRIEIYRNFVGDCNKFINSIIYYFVVVEHPLVNKFISTYFFFV